MLSRRWVCGCIPYKPLINQWGEETGICEFCTFVYDENLCAMRTRQHWSDPDNPIPEGAEDLDTILRAISPEYRASVEV